MQATQNTTYAGACDCHVHIYHDNYPTVPNLAWLPPHLPVSTYRAAQKAVGLRRAVIVQPAAYGFDNSARWTRWRSSVIRAAALRWCSQT